MRFDKLTLWTVLWLSVFCTTAGAQDKPATNENSDNRAEARKRIDAMTASVTSNGTAQPLKFSKDPILVFSDPTRKESTGTVWAIGTEGRPKAILSLFTISGEKFWSYEFTSLTTETVTSGKPPKWEWKPKGSGLTLHDLKSDPVPANSPAARLTQMKSIARGFSATEVYHDTTRTELRLLTQPLLRYADESQNIVDGALFAFANGTNPEILIVIEAVKANGGMPQWRYGAARMSSAELHLQLNDAEVWTIEVSKKDLIENPYYSRRESLPPPGFN